jgi:hypothetical protein
MSKIRLIILMLCMPSIVYANDPRLYYWAPLGNYGGLYKEDSERISGQWGVGLFGAHYRFSPKISVTAATHGFANTEVQDVSYRRAGGFDGVLKVSPDFSRIRLFSKRVQGYGQGGIWVARVKAVGKRDEGKPQAPREKVLKIPPKWERASLLKGSGLVLGIGVYCELSSRLFFDFSAKRLLAIRALHRDMSHSYLLTLGFGIRL